VTFETVWCSMPMLTFVSHLSLVHSNVFCACITELGKHSLKTHTTKWPPFLHDVTLTTELGVTLKTREVLHVPATSFSLCTLISKDNLKWRRFKIKHYI